MPFAVGERVWVCVSEGGTDFWPAKVENPLLMGYTESSGDDVFVQFYKTQQVAMVPDTPTSICSYDKDPSKRATSNPEILEAIAEADADADAAGTVGGAAQADTTASREKRARRERPSKKADTTTTAAQPAQREDEMHMSDTEALALKSDLDAAAEAEDIPAVRRILLRLARTRTNMRQLTATKIGASVGNLLAVPSMEPVFGVVRVVIRFWAQALPAVTQNALRSVAARKLASTAADESGQAPQQTTGTRSRATHFSERLREALGMDNHPELLDNIGPVANELEAAANSRARREMLIETLEKPDHTELRQELLKRAITADNFFWLPKSKLMTPAEVAEQDRINAEKLAAKEASEATMLVISTMYECPKCGARKCTFYEQQTRGGDEPMTIFITCQECKTHWQKGGYD